MKIFHALLRLTILTHALATIVTPPNVPAVFDGYVDNKSIKNREPNFQVDGTDLALEERGVDGGDIESRQIPGEGVMLIVIAVIIVIGLAADLAYHIKEDILRREAYTQQVVSNMYANNSNANYVVCHTTFDFWFDGTQGTDWNHLHHELPISMGRTIGYEIYWFRSGTFRRWGDGGFINWAYTGNVLSRTYGSPDLVVFGRPK